MMMTFITQGGEGKGNTRKKSKTTKSKGRGREEGASRTLMMEDDDGREFAKKCGVNRSCTRNH